MQLILHSGAESATRQEVLAVPCPEAGSLGKRHHPVSYGDMLTMIDHRIAKMGFTVQSESFGLNSKDQQLFGVMSIDTGIKDENLAFGFRNSLNKSLSLGLCAGHHGLVCDNLCFSGSFFTAIRKNTKKAHEQFRIMLLDQCDRALDNFNRLRADFKSMAKVNIDMREGYALLGQMVGDDALKVMEFSAALENWQQDTHKHGRTLWGVYNAATWGAKKCKTNVRLPHLLGIHQWWGGEMVRRGIEPVSVLPVTEGLEID
jgi:hypothetical protein